MRWPTLRRKHPRPVRLGDWRRVSYHTFVIDGERYMLTNWSHDFSGRVVINLELRGQFIERNTVRAPKRRLVDRVLRRKGAGDA